MLANFPNIAIYIRNIDNFIEDAKCTFPENIDDKDLVRFYLNIKEHKVIKDSIHICKNFLY